MKYQYIMVLLLALPWQVAAQPADSIQGYLDSCLQLLENNSLYADRVQWPTIRQQVLDKAKSAQQKSDGFEALQIAFEALGDKHAAYYQYNDSYRINNDALLKRYSGSLREEWAKGPRITTQMIGHIAYISVPFMGAKNQQQIDWYANWLYDSIASLQLKKPRAWIIDLRLNGGGNIRPMMAGLAPFFADGIVSYYINKDGSACDEAAFSNGNYLINGMPQATIKNKIHGLFPVKVAVLTGPGTASSGELTAAVFSERLNTILIGSNTAGLANATNGFLLNGGDTYFLISTAAIANHRRVPFPETIYPTLPVNSNDAFTDIENDTTVRAALDWLKR